MGTRSLTLIYGEGRAIVNMYRQYDGYPSGHGKDLYNFLKDGRVVNGYSAKTEHLFNGMGCLAAQMVANFKKGVGGFYLFHPDEQGCGQEYEYHVSFVGGEIWVKVLEGSDVVCEGNLAEFEAFCFKEED